MFNFVLEMYQVFLFYSVRSLDAFVSYLRTRESVLRRHYTTNALLRGGSGLLSGGSGGTLIAALAPLANMPFNLDLLWQLKDMHRSFKRMEDMMSNEVDINPLLRHIQI